MTPLLHRLWRQFPLLLPLAFALAAAAGTARAQIDYGIDQIVWTMLYGVTQAQINDPTWLARDDDGDGVSNGTGGRHQSVRPDFGTGGYLDFLGHQRVGAELSYCRGQAVRAAGHDRRYHPGELDDALARGRRLRNRLADDAHRPVSAQGA